MVIQGRDALYGKPEDLETNHHITLEISTLGIELRQFTIFKYTLRKLQLFDITIDFINIPSNFAEFMNKKKIFVS